jgi:hypothetical protein
MISFFSKKYGTSLLVDIGNGSVSAALVDFSGKKPLVVSYSRVAFVTGERPRADSLTAKVVSAIDSAVKKTVSFKTHRGFFKNGISSVTISFASPWFSAKTKKISVKDNSKSRITRDFIDKIVSKERKIFEKETGLSGLECFPVEAEIKGYKIENILGKETENFFLTLYVSAADPNLLGSVLKIISKKTGILSENINVHTFPFVTSRVIHSFFPNETEFLMMDITGEITDMTLVSSGKIEKMVSFPSGRNSVLRKIADNFSVSVEIAGSLFNLYLNNKLENETLEKMGMIVSSWLDDWSKHLTESLSEFSTEASPRKIYLTSDKDMADFIRKIIKNHRGADSSEIFDEVVLVDEKIFQDAYDRRKFPADNYIEILIVFCLAGIRAYLQSNVGRKLSNFERKS